MECELVSWGTNRWIDSSDLPFCSVGPKKRKEWIISLFWTYDIVANYEQHIFGGEEMLSLVHLYGGMGWETVPKTDSAPRSRTLRESGTGSGDKETNTITLWRRGSVPQKFVVDASYRTACLRVQGGSPRSLCPVLKPWWQLSWQCVRCDVSTGKMLRRVHLHTRSKPC